MAPTMLIEAYLDELGAAAIRQAHGIEAPALARATQDAKFGDFQLNGAMPLAKQLKKPPRELAQPIAEALLRDEAIAAAEVAGPGFINVTLDDAWIARQLGRALADDEGGVPPVPRPETTIVDFSSPNIAKQMHVGHLRSTIIGDAIARLLSCVGHRVIKDNHLGDWGTQFGLLIAGMRAWGDEAALEKDPIVELERIYKQASAKAAEDDAFAALARAELAKLQAGDAENLALWRRFVEVSKQALNKVYAQLEVEFDEWLGESAYDTALPGVVETLLKKKLAREDDGAICVFWDELEGAPAALKNLKTPFIVRKRDGAFLYSTTDIATVLYRRSHFKADRAIYVVDNRQALHFKQLFAVMKSLGVEMALDHVGFGTVLGDDGKPLRTRDANGHVITLQSLLDEACERARARIEEGIADGKLRVPEAEIEAVSRAVGIGAVKYADLKQNRMSDYQFDWDKMLSFAGNAGPYLQYAYARCQSVFRKGNLQRAGFEAPITLGTPEEATLGRRLLRFADAVHQAAETHQPHVLCEHLYETARTFSAFYAACPILDADEPTRSSRLALTALVADQLHRGLGLVGIGVVDQM